jgi:hypothetical protein
VVGEDIVVPRKEPDGSRQVASASVASGRSNSSTPSSVR